MEETRTTESLAAEQVDKYEWPDGEVRERVMEMVMSAIETDKELWRMWVPLVLERRNRLEKISRQENRWSNVGT